MLFTTLLLPLATSAAVLQERQLLSTAYVSKVEKLEPRYRKTANRNVYKLGPITLGGATKSWLGDSTSQGELKLLSMPKTLCNKEGPCTILAAKTGVVFADGKDANPATGIYIHHILTSDYTKKQTPWLSNCDSEGSAALNIAALAGGTAFVGTGEDSAEGGTLYTSEDGTRDSGYHVGANDQFGGMAQLVNYNKEAKQVYVYYDLEWVPGIVGADVKGGTYTATCGNGFAIKLSATGPTNTTSGKFYIKEDGKILGARGHMHDGGVRMDMLITSNENGETRTCTSEAVYGIRGEGGMGGHSHGAAGGMGTAGTPGKDDKESSSASIKTISSMTTCKGPIPVKKGDTLRMVAVYDLSVHPLRQAVGGGKQADVMGMWGISFAADKK